MAITVRGESNDTIDRVAAALANYQHRHFAARIEIHRQNSVAIYIRVIDPDLAPISRADRHELLWKSLEKLPEEDQSQISLLLALTPEETARSFANLEFDHPSLTPL